MIKLLLLFATYQLTASKRLLLQKTRGTYNQPCIPPESDFPCQRTFMTLTDQQNGDVECGVDYGCCLCETIICGSSNKACDSFKAGGENAAFGVEDIRIYGEPDSSGAVIDCGAPNSCSATHITGSWIDTLKCGGDSACSSAVVDISQSRGLTCDTGACIAGTFLLNSNRGGAVDCGARHACVNALIEINGIQDVKCGGISSCQNAKIFVTDPLEHFHLDCNGYMACENLEIELIIPASASRAVGGTCFFRDVVEYKGISCGAGGGCKGMKFTIRNDGCDIIRLEDLQCGPGEACTGAIFDFNAGNTITGGVQLNNCMCGPSCVDATGIDMCYNNVQVLECVDFESCAMQQRSITNPANDFVLLCMGVESCFGFELELVVAGGSGNLVRRFTGFECGGIMACKEAVITIVNTQATSDGQNVLLSVADVICSEREACDGATFITGVNVEIQRVVCSAGACNNCVVKQSVDSVGVPCDPSTPAPTRAITTTTTTTYMPLVIPGMPVVPSTTTTTTTLSMPPIPVLPDFIPIEIPGVRQNPAVVSPQSPIPPITPVEMPPNTPVEVVANEIAEVPPIELPAIPQNLPIPPIVPVQNPPNEIPAGIIV